MMRPQGPLLDPEIIAMLRQLGVLELLLPKFVDGLPAQVAALRQALSTGDRQAARQLAHRLRGSADQMGATALARAFADIEAATGQGSGELAGLDTDLDDLVSATAAAVRRVAADG